MDQEPSKEEAERRAVAVARRMLTTPKKERDAPARHEEPSPRLKKGADRKRNTHHC
jgi:hypothetical protein